MSCLRKHLLKLIIRELLEVDLILMGLQFLELLELRQLGLLLEKELPNHLEIVLRD